MSKQIPNILSILRIVLSLILLGITPMGIPFVVLYLLCGVTDFLDGFIARKFNLTSSLGATLDSVADCIFFIIYIIIFIPLFNFPIRFLLWICIILIIRLLSLCLGYHKYKQLSFIHTYGNKLTGLLIFLLPLSYYTIYSSFFSVSILLIGTFSALEELLINLTAKNLNKNRKTYLHKESN